MNKIKMLTNDQLNDSLKVLVLDERKTLNLILDHLCEVERRRLFAQMGYSSLFEYVVKVLGYSESAAGRRIAAMRLMREVPQIKEKVESGKLSLTTLSKANQHFRQEAKNAAPLTQNQKSDLLLSLEGKSQKQVERQLVDSSPSLPRPVHPESRPLKDDWTELTLRLNGKQMAEFERLKELKGQGMSWAELAMWAVQRSLKQVDPLRKADNTKNAIISQPSQPSPKIDGEATKQKPKDYSPNIRRIYLKKSIRQQVWENANGQCQFVSPQTNRRCQCKTGLEIDHIVPLAKNGGNDLSNLQLLCRSHNQLRAIMDFGPKKMADYLPGIE